MESYHPWFVFPFILFRASDMSSVEGEIYASATSPTKQAAKDWAGYKALVKFRIPILYPNADYLYLNKTEQLYDHLIEMEGDHHIQWEADKRQGDQWVANILGALCLYFFT